MSHEPQLTARVVHANGRLWQGPLPASAHRRNHLQWVGSSIDGHLEIAAGPRIDGKWRVFTRRRADGYTQGGYEQRDDAWLQAACAVVERHLAHGWEISIGYASRSRPAGSGDAVSGSRVIWCDDDSLPDRPEPRMERLLRLLPPHLVVFSGRGRHIAWRLADRIPPDRLASVQQRLARTANGDRQAGRPHAVLRLAGTPNTKYHPARWAYIADLDFARLPYAADRIERILEPARRPAPRRRRSRHPRPAPTDDLAFRRAKALEPETYFELLAPHVMSTWSARDRTVRCPHPRHDDHTPSCHLYPTPEQGWHCFGDKCPGAGGDVFDLAAVLDYGCKASALDRDQFRGLKVRTLRTLGVR